MADDDNEKTGGMYEDGHWVWDEATNGLLFVSERPPVAAESTMKATKAPTGTIKFRDDDVDLLEQLRYRRRYQRKLKPGQPDVITIQDAKDLAIYTAPVDILSPTLINMLHLPTTERFIKALILCVQYYLQVEEQMSLRMCELDTKVRTPFCDIIETEYHTNLYDLRILVAKEYCTILLELEINRLFKSEIFNTTEHTLKTNYIAKMVKEERSVLLGSCVRRDKKLNTRSPLLNEVFCHRDIDYRMMGLGVIKQTRMTPRLLYMYHAVASSEDKLGKLGISLGIIGKPRSAFDTMLKPIPIAIGGMSVTDAKSKSMAKGVPSTMNSRSAANSTPFKLYTDIVLPPRAPKDDYYPPAFPEEPEPPRLCSETQRRRWQKRLHRLTHPQPAAQ